MASPFHSYLWPKAVNFKTGELNRRPIGFRQRYTVLHFACQTDHSGHCRVPIFQKTRHGFCSRIMSSGHSCAFCFARAAGW